MANKEQVSLLRQGVKVWNTWREENPEVEIDLSYSNFSRVNLSKANLSKANLSYAILRSADLNYADLSSTDLRSVNFRGADLSRSILSGTILSHADLSDADLSKTNLSGAILNDAILKSVNLGRAKLLLADLSSTDLSNSDLSNSDLRGASLTLSQALGTKFMDTDLTGACIANWQIDRETNFKGVRCNYIYRGYDTQKHKFTEQLPENSDKFFQAGEFEVWIRTSIEASNTINLTFTDGMHWQKFYQSLLGIRQEYPDSGVILQAIEKQGSAFVVRLKTAPGSDQNAIKLRLLELYGPKLQLQAARGEARILHERNGHLKQLTSEGKSKPTSQPTIHARDTGVQSNSSDDIKDFTQNIGNNLDEISYLIKSLKETAQNFPEEQKGIVLGQLKDLENNLQNLENIQPQPIGRQLKRLLIASAATATLADTTATETVDLSKQANEFTINVLELSHVLDIELAQDKQKI